MNYIKLHHNVILNLYISAQIAYLMECQNYNEIHPPNSKDLYGFSKMLGELNYKNSLTLRTSIIGHELRSKLSLVDWFLVKKNLYRLF